MLDVVSLYMTLPDRTLKADSIPTVLRKAVTKKFPEFDVYQLAKYNKERAQKRKAKKEKESKPPTPALKWKKQQKLKRQPMAIEKPEEPKKLTLKQLVRKAHIAQPADSIMAIVGKRYPDSQDAFVKTGMKGEWDSARSTKRMKLPTPETWETMLSAHGNKHTTWQSLIDAKKLPFMAMLRNLRNLIITGISPEHHEIVLNRLTDEKSVTNSRQLPWRFISAYEAINIDLEKLMNDILDNDGNEDKMIQVNVRGNKGEKMRVGKKKVIIPTFMPDEPLIAKYRAAIDTAIRISTMNNVKPIRGNCVVFCDVSGSMQTPCSTKGNMGSVQNVMDIAILLGLMLQDVCDSCDFRLFSSPGHLSKGRCDIAVPLQENTILENIKRVLKASEGLGGGTDFPYDYLFEMIEKKTKIDTFIILSDMMIAPGKNEMNLRGSTVSQVLKEFRDKVNPDMLFVAIDLYGSGKSIVDINTDNPKNVMITGFSDNVLRFIAEHGDKKQLEHVLNIDESKGLNKPKEKKKNQNKMEM